MSIDAPGMRVRKRKSGPAYYWIAADISSLSKGYPSPTVRLHQATEDGRAARCRVLTAELKHWIATKGQAAARYDGTIAGLIRCYQTDEDSPYHAVKHNTRADYDYSLGVVEKAVGKRKVEALTRADFSRWYKNFRAPAQPGGPERVRRAYGCIKVIRIIMGYGKSMRYAGCRDVVETLEEMRFELPARRKEAVSYEQAKAIVEVALAAGNVPVALGQAFQFELSLRQIDVIGEWVPVHRDEGGIIDRGRRWTGGLAWPDVSPDLILRKQTTKTAALGEWDLRKYPLVMAVLEHVPADKRMGPIVICAATGKPYRANKYQKEWRALARAAGVPDTVWNRDSRAGGITEGDDAGADPRDLQKLATHSDFKTTQRYIRSSTRRSTDKVAELRSAARKGQRT